jgi:NADP-dependent 3-hydroxy acid dehydrogenase YdfG
MHASTLRTMDTHHDPHQRRRLGAAVVLGARNLGGAIARDLLAHATRVASVARTQSDLDLLAADGALPFAADAADLEQLDSVLTRAADELGTIGLIVNAVSAARPPADGTAFGGGTIAGAGPAGLEGWTLAPIRQAFTALKTGTAALRDGGGTFVQIVGAPARRADPERGLIAAVSGAVRALTHAAAQEVRASGVHVALLIVDGIIESPKTARMTEAMPPEALVREQDVAEAVRFLASQPERAMTHELVITPVGSRWLP